MWILAHRRIEQLACCTISAFAELLVLMTTAYKLVWRLVQTSMKKRMLVGAIVFVWLVIPALR